MSVTRSNLILITVVSTIILASAISIGYATSYNGTTNSASQTVNVHYVIVEINDNGSGALTDTFVFDSADKPAYYTHTIVGSGTTYNVPDYTGTSTLRSADLTKFEFVGANTDEITLSAALDTTGLPAGFSITIQLYEDQSCEQAHGEPLVMSASSSTATVDDETCECDTTYYCRATVTFTGGNYNNVPSSISIPITFTATASYGDD